MDLLKTIWPTPFKIKEKDLTALIVQIIILILISVVVAVAMVFLALIPIVGLLVGIVASLVDLYCLVGIVLCVLKYLDVLK